MDIEAISARLARRFGSEVADWCARLPTLVTRTAHQWGLTIGEPLPEGASSVTLACQLPDGTHAVLKFSPDRSFQTEQAAMLRLLAPSGRVPAVLDFDPDSATMLMEAIQPGTEAGELPSPPSPEKWADLLAPLHAIAIPTDLGRTLRQRCDEFFHRIGRRLHDPAIAAHISQDTWNRAIRRCGELLDTPAKQVVLHGDLHLGNVLDGGPERGLVAIDPKICVGDPCFDAVDFVLAGAGHEGIRTRCAQVADACGLDPARMHAWCQVIAPITAIAYLDDAAALPELLALAR